MIVLKAIGKFFARIGRWIKETAWVQPLLIVGGIFAIIFAIPKTISWVKTWFPESSDSITYYRSTERSLIGAKDKKSAADDLFDYLETYKEVGDEIKNDSRYSKYGSKFFIAFVQEDCSACETNYEAFSTAQKVWNDGDSFKVNDGKSFAIQTIFADTVEEIDDKDENVFTEYFYKNHYEFFENVTENYNVSPFYNNSDSSFKTSIENISNYEMTSPTIFLVDFDATITTGDNYFSDYGVTEFMFTVSGSDKYAKAANIIDCWNHANEFGEANYNK